MKRLLFLLAFVVSALVVPSVAQARSCGTWGTTPRGGEITIDAYYGASCSFASATADRFYAVSGVPRHLRVLGTRMTHETTKNLERGTFWLYDGRRYGRYVSVIIMVTRPAPSAPVVPSSPPPGNGYPVVCNDGTVSTSGGIQGACSHHGGVSG